MNNNKDKLMEKEIILEEYMLGKEYYGKIQEKAKEENKNIEQ